MRLDELTGGLAAAIHGGDEAGGAQVEIEELAYDSRTVRRGALFFCVPGFQSDGHEFAGQALAAGAAAPCAIEASSHALALGRCDAIHYAAAVFTNMSRDHLDFHGTMEDYFDAKRRLFCVPAGVAGKGGGARTPGSLPAGPGASVVN